MRAPRPILLRVAAAMATIALSSAATTDASAATTKVDIETVPPGAEVFMVTGKSSARVSTLYCFFVDFLTIVFNKRFVALSFQFFKKSKHG